MIVKELEARDIDDIVYNERRYKRGFITRTCSFEKDLFYNLSKELDDDYRVYRVAPNIRYSGIKDTDIVYLLEQAKKDFPNITDYYVKTGAVIDVYIKQMKDKSKQLDADDEVVIIDDVDDTGDMYKNRYKPTGKHKIECYKAEEYVLENLSDKVPRKYYGHITNVIKYVWRCNYKDGYKDLKKAADYINFMFEE